MIEPPRTCFAVLFRELNVPPENERAGGSPPGVPERLKGFAEQIPVFRFEWRKLNAHCT
jgi:hypothetical protein